MHSWQSHQTPVTKITYTVSFVAASAFGWGLYSECTLISVCMHASTYVCMYCMPKSRWVCKYVPKRTVYKVCKLFEYNYMLYSCRVIAILHHYALLMI